MLLFSKARSFSCLTALCRFAFLWFTGAVCLVASAGAQYHFDSWTTENGLPHNRITGIVQSSDGYLWLSTMDGLVRYDGVHFTVINSGNTPGFKGNRCTTVFEDHTGQLWIGTEDSGLIRYRNGIFTSFSMEQGLPENFVRRIWSDDAGQVVLF